MARHEVRLAGFGGQGIVLAGYIVGKAAALYDGKDAVFSQSYGPEARGGACAAEVVIDDDMVDYRAHAAEHPGDVAGSGEVPGGHG
jgi:2-oxoglutarate ferredoxin oxidoreductase subunit gamma